MSNFKNAPMMSKTVESLYGLMLNLLCSKLFFLQRNYKKINYFLSSFIKSFGSVSFQNGTISLFSFNIVNYIRKLVSDILRINISNLSRAIC